MRRLTPYLRFWGQQHMLSIKVLIKRVKSAQKTRLLMPLALVSAGALLAGCGASLDTNVAAPLGGGAAVGAGASAAREAAAGTTTLAAAAKSNDKAALGSTAVNQPTGAVDKAAAAAFAAATPGSTAYKVGPLDVLEITVFKVAELSKLAQVADSGTINLPLVGDVMAAGRTASDIEKDLVAKLGAKYLKDPQVSVYVKEFNSQRITVEGAVKKPGVFPLKGRTTLLQAIAMSEGLDVTTASTAVMVFRQTNGTKSGARFELDDIRAGTIPDPDLVKGDLVVVDTSAGKTAFNNLTRVLPITSLFRPF